MRKESTNAESLAQGGPEAPVILSRRQAFCVILGISTSPHVLAARGQPPCWCYSIRS
jgi:hypothetical protein